MVVFAGSFLCSPFFVTNFPLRHGNSFNTDIPTPHPRIHSSFLCLLIHLKNNNSLFSPVSIPLAYRPSLCSPFSTNQPTAIAACSFHPHNKGPEFTSQQQRKKKHTTATPSIQSESGGLSKLDPHNVESQAHVFSKLRVSQSHTHTSTYYSLLYFPPYHLCRLLFCIYSATIFAISFSLLQQRPSSQTLSRIYSATTFCRKKP